MTGTLILDWGILFLSLFNTISLLWLALTVLLNANRRNLGVWLMSGGLLTGALFFVTHIAILAQSITLSFEGLNFWWRTGWLPVTIAPYAWYVVILWFSGFWHQPRNALHRRHRRWLWPLSAVFVALLLSLLLTNPIPSYEAAIGLYLASLPMINGIPIILIAIPALMVLSIGLSIDVLLHPAPARLAAIEIGRQRARPWLLAAAVLLLVVSLLVCAFVAWAVTSAGRDALLRMPIDMIGLFDLLLSLLITVATVLMGQAVVAYEVFTGRVLPRRRLVRQWRVLLLLAAGCAAVIAMMLVFQVRMIYGVLLTTLMMVAVYALYSWRTFVEHEEFMRRLRPFVGSQRLLARLMSGEPASTSHAQALFDALCRDVLRTQRALLMPLGALAPLAGAPLSFPQSADPQVPMPPLNLHRDPLPLNDPGDDGYRWVMPLWAARGMIGALFVGRKSDGEPYTQEEFDIAQASGERIIDMLAGEQMAQRLMQLQRKRFTAYRVTDLETRRALHDDVLPALHSTILQLGALAQTDAAARAAIALLSEQHQRISGLIRLARPAADSAEDTGDFAAHLRRIIDQEFGGKFVHIDWRCAGLPPRIHDPLVREVVLGAVRELVRNAAVHGPGAKGSGKLNLTIDIDSKDALYIRIRDDGIGIQNADPATRNGGSGLELHRTLLAAVGGDCTVMPHPPGGTEATITLPWTSLSP